MKQIHDRAPAPAPLGLSDRQQIVHRLRSQREGSTVAAVRSRLTEV